MAVLVSTVPLGAGPTCTTNVNMPVAWVCPLSGGRKSPSAQRTGSVLRSPRPPVAVTKVV